jgi:Ca2+-binding EF-hand superfamily protein
MQLFREIDESGDALISRREFSLAMRALSLNLPKSELTMLFQMLDPDGSNTIDYEELCAALGS